MLTTVLPLLPYSAEKLLFSTSRKESVEIRGTRSPECPVVQLALVASVITRVFDLLRTVTNAIFYHLSFNCQAKSLVQDTIVVDCLKSNTMARSLLQSFGFTYSRPLTRMYRGANLHPGRAERLCAILGPEFG